MHYITNQTGQVIAVDNDLLTRLQLKTIDELNQKILLKEIQFTPPLQHNMMISTPLQTLHFTVDQSILTSMFGELILTKLKVSSQETHSKKTDDHIALSDLTLTQTPQNVIETINMKEINTTDTTPIIISLDEVSENIGISSEDYTVFLNEFIDTAFSLEPNLRSMDEQTYASAVETLTQLIEVLQLPQIEIVTQKLALLSPENNNHTVNLFYATLSRLTTDTSSLSQRKKEVHKEETPHSQIALTQTNTQTTGTSPALQLRKIEPIPFYFNIETVADSLGLPLELVEEFIDDFILQAHKETNNMVRAYEKKDMATIQNIAHLLKEASSNLRIHTLSDALYEIQFANTYEMLAARIQSYWAHFLSFEAQRENMKKEKGKM